MKPNEVKRKPDIILDNPNAKKRKVDTGKK